MNPTQAAKKALQEACAKAHLPQPDYLEIIQTNWLCIKICFGWTKYRVRGYRFIVHSTERREPRLASPEQRADIFSDLLLRAPLLGVPTYQ